MSQLARVEPKNTIPSLSASENDLTLTYIFERSTKITDLMAAIGRAGQVLKVVLWDELPTGSTRKALP